MAGGLRSGHLQHACNQTWYAICAPHCDRPAVFTQGQLKIQIATDGAVVPDGKSSTDNVDSQWEALTKNPWGATASVRSDIETLDTFRSAYSEDTLSPRNGAELRSGYENGARSESRTMRGEIETLDTWRAVSPLVSPRNAAALPSEVENTARAELSGKPRQQWVLRFGAPPDPESLPSGCEPTPPDPESLLSGFLPDPDLPAAPQLLQFQPTWPDVAHLLSQEDRAHAFDELLRIPDFLETDTAAAAIEPNGFGSLTLAESQLVRVRILAAEIGRNASLQSECSTPAPLQFGESPLPSQLPEAQTSPPVVGNLSEQPTPMRNDQVAAADSGKLGSVLFPEEPASPQSNLELRSPQAAVTDEASISRIPKLCMLFVTNSNEERRIFFTKSRLGMSFQCMKGTDRVTVAKVVEGGHADELGVQAGWRVQEVDGKDVTSISVPAEAINAFMVRNSPRSSPRQALALKIEFRAFRSEVHTLVFNEAPLGMEFDVEKPFTVKSVVPSSYAYVCGVRPGWQIVKVGNQPVRHMGWASVRQGILDIEGALPCAGL